MPDMSGNGPNRTADVEAVVAALHHHVAPHVPSILAAAHRQVDAQRPQDLRFVVDDEHLVLAVMLVPWSVADGEPAARRVGSRVVPPISDEALNDEIPARHRCWCRGRRAVGTGRTTRPPTVPRATPGLKSTAISTRLTDAARVHQIRPSGRTWRGSVIDQVVVRSNDPPSAAPNRPRMTVSNRPKTRSTG